jgi:hypothetical protein
MPSGECHVFRCPSSNTPGVTSFLRFAYSSTRAAKLAAKGVANEVPDFRLLFLGSRGFYAGTDDTEVFLVALCRRRCSEFVS